MKKIVGLLAAAAVLATSVFAADVSAAVKVGGSIFDMDATVKNKDGDEANSISILKAETVSATYDSPFATLSTSTDNAGGTVKFVKNGSNVGWGEVQVWFKPIDTLKIQAGHQDFAMNKETIDWTEHHGQQAFGTYGYSLGFAQDAISVNLALGTTDGGYFYQDAIGAHGSDADGNAALIRDLYANFAYGADFGTISAFFRYQGKTWSAKACTPDTISFGAAYKNTIDALTFFVNVVGTSKSAWTDDEAKVIQAGAAADSKPEDFEAYTDKNGKFRSAFGFGVDAFVAYTADALTVKGFVKYDTKDFGHLTLKDGELKEDIMADNNTIVELLARVDYKLDNGIGLFAYFKNANLLRKEVQGTDTDPTSVFVSTIKAGANGSVGIASWEVALQLGTGNVGAKDKKYNKVNVSMPCFVKVGF